MSWNFDELSPGETVIYNNEYKLFTKTEFNRKCFLTENFCTIFKFLNI
jgi:hypothetical protein